MRRPFDFGYFLELLAFGSEVLVSLFSQTYRDRLRPIRELPTHQKVGKIAELTVGVIIAIFMATWLGFTIVSWV